MDVQSIFSLLTQYKIASFGYTFYDYFESVLFGLPHNLESLKGLPELVAMRDQLLWKNLSTGNEIHSLGVTSCLISDRPLDGQSSDTSCRDGKYDILVLCQ